MCISVDPSTLTVLREEDAMPAFKLVSVKNIWKGPWFSSEEKVVNHYDPKRSYAATPLSLETISAHNGDLITKGGFHSYVDTYVGALTSYDRKRWETLWPYSVDGIDGNRKESPFKLIPVYVWGAIIYSYDHSVVVSGCWAPEENWKNRRS